MVVPPSSGSGGHSSTTAQARLSPSAAPSPDGEGTPPAKGSKDSKLRGFNVSAPGTLNGPPSGNNHAIPLSARRAEPMDLNSVERRGQPNMRQERVRNQRLFDIPNAPIYRPTDEEFRDPMEYMRKIAPEGSKYGIVKIIPPDTWNPTFAINTERFHFRTRRQELNSVEGGNRVNSDYLDQLAKFHKQNGHNLNRFPSVDKRPLDLYRLKKTVERKGGFDMVCKGKRWAEVGRDLGYSGKIMSSLSTSLKNSYQKWLLPYEEYLRMAKPGVQQHLEMMNGGPYTPSPGPSPAKPSHGASPYDHIPTMQASVALNATMNGHSPQPVPPHHDTSQPQPYGQQSPFSQHPSQAPTSLPPPPASSGGGFTAVNAGGFTAVNTQPQPAPSFTSVNGSVSGPNGAHSNSATPQRSVEGTPSNAGPQLIAPHPNGVAALKRQHSELTPEEVELMNRRSKRLKKDVPTVVGSNMHHSRMSAGRYQQARDRGSYKPGEVCEACFKPDEPHKRLKCESCENLYHMYCLEPPLKQAPDHEWHCPRCLVGTNEYGFEDGDVYSLSGFQRKASEFKMYHFSSMPPQHSPFNESKRHLEEEDVEREFWRLVEDMSDSVEVEYGADIHSTTHGSGFPTIEKHPRDPYSTDPWNLNILPLDKDSLFRHIRSDVSGMTVPWLYVGMVFSTFCWHNEDHYTYSANYQHFGDTKTWYGIPGEDSYKFEDAMKHEVPELFETQPDLLFQLVTLAKPEKLRKAGVRVYAIDQHAGEFVITFPRAYHAGFNHGFNLNEAVNFAPNDWEPFGAEGVKRLRDYRKQPCFSHDEMLLTAASRDNTIKTAKWLAPAMERMRDDELATREHFLTSPEPGADNQHQEPYTGPRYQARPEIIDTATEEDEVICTFCKAFCHLSRYLCKKTNKVFCLLHAGSYECCDALEHERFSGQNGEHTVYYRMKDDALRATVQKVVDKANIPEAWAAKVDKELEDTSRPTLKHLRTLLTEGEKIQYELPQLADLRRFVDRCNEWVEEATSYITRKSTNRRKSDKPWRKGSKAADLEERDKELRKISNIYQLLSNAEQIGFDCQEITTLRERADSIEEFQSDANAALSNIHAKTTGEFEELLDRGKDFHVDMPELENLERVLKRMRWNDDAKSKRPNAETGRQDQTLSDIDKFIAAGVEIGVPDTNPDIAYFRAYKVQGEVWEQKAKELMAAEQVHYQQLDALSHQAAQLPVTKETLAQVDAILKKQREIQDKIQSLVQRSRDPEFRNRPHYREMKEVTEAIEQLQSKPNGAIDLEKESRRHEDWMRRGKKLFGKANAPLHILQQHMNIVDQRNQACFDLSDKPRGPVEPSSRAGTPEDGAQMTEGSGSSRDVFCICRKPEAGMMIECELCHEWYHGKCLKIARGKVKEDDKYTCPICDWRIKIPRDAARPKLEDLQAWQDELDTLPFQPAEEETLSNICEYGQEFRNFIRPFVEPAMEPTTEELPILRFYLRKIEGADILLSPETNYLRQTLHRLAKVAPEAPPILEASHSTRKPRPTKQQKLMAHLGITNPDDLPTQYKLKPHMAKRKISEGMLGQPLQVSASSPTGSTTPGVVPGSAGSAQPNMSGMTPVPAPRKNLTALALQVLDKYASHPIVDDFLGQEPHANRDRLLKVKAVLKLPNLESYTTDIDTFKAKVNSMPLPAAHTPGGANLEERRPSASSSKPHEQPVFSTVAPGPYPTLTGGPRLASPPTFHHGFQSQGPSSPQNYGQQMFDTTSNMFGTPTSRPEHIPSGMLAGMFDSPKQLDGSSTAHGTFTTNAGINSPGFGGSQQSAGGTMDNVFAELVHDQDDAIPGLDPALESSSQDIRDGKETPATSAPAGDAKASSEVDDELKYSADVPVPGELVPTREEQNLGG